MTSSIVLMLVFAAAVAAVYYICPKNARKWILLAASAIFYVSAGIRIFILAAGGAAWSYAAALMTFRSERKKRWFLAAIIPATAVLFVYKYLNLSILGLALPLGISYYTFKMLSYNADVFMGRRAPEQGAEGFAAYLTYVLFFPQILSGPIERSEGFLKTWHEGAVYDRTLFSSGCQLIVLGLFKKMVIANRLGAYVDTIYAAPEDYPGLALVMAAVLYSFQLYCDFSGYSDIAFGLSGIFGYEGVRNFDCPYFARGIKEFWSRWHISLSSWLRDYIYIPLGGNRKGRVRRGVNIMITFLVSGFWHGAGLTFIFWGALHGLWNLIGKRKKEGGLFRKARQTLVTFAGVTLCWVFFRADSIGDAFLFIKRAVTGFSLSYAFIQNSILPFTGDNTCAAYFITVCIFIFALFLYERNRVYGAVRVKNRKSSETAEVLTTPWIVFMTLSTLLFGVFGSSGFLYAGF